MCFYTLIFLPIFFAVQTVVRILMTVLFAAEDLIRTIILAVHNWIMSSIHAITMIPLCLAYCCSKNCVCPSSCSPPCYIRSTSCGCILFIIMVLVITLVIYYSIWVEDLFARFGIKFPCIFEKQQENSGNIDAIPNVEALKNENSANNYSLSNPYTSTKQSHSASKQLNDLKNSYEERIKHEKLEIKNYLDEMYIDNFKKEKDQLSFMDTNTMGVLDTTVIEGVLEESYSEVTVKTKGSILKILEDVILTTNNPIGNYLEHVV